jgi:hypothetical protein
MTFLTLLAVLAVPAVAAALPSAPGDGTLSVRNGDGLIRLELIRGAAIGRIGDGTLTVVDPHNDDCEAPLVWDDGERAEFEKKIVVVRSEPTVFETRCVFRGVDMRFRLIGHDGDTFRLRGESIGLSAVGRGSVYLDGRGEGPDGTYSLNGEEYASLPDDGRTLRLAAPDPGI